MPLILFELLCDTIAGLDEGQLRFVGSPAQCCREYGTDNLESADMNCIERRIAADRDNRNQLDLQSVA